MEDTQPRKVADRIAAAVRSGFTTALRTILFLLRIIVPVTLLVALLDWFGVLAWIAHLMSPVMGLVGLPGGAALILISSVFLNIYSAIAVAIGMPLDMRAATIIAIMCLTAHNLIVETAVMKKTGSSGVKMVLLRIGAAFFMAFVFDQLLPSGLATIRFSSAGNGAHLSFPGMLIGWGISTARLGLKIVLIVLGVMIAQRLLEEFKAMAFLSRFFTPIMKLFGLPSEASFLWIVINVVGYAYGAGIIEEQVHAGRMKPQDAEIGRAHV